MAEAARLVWGQPYDSPNFQVAYNALLQLGIFADVHMENAGLWRPWTSPSLEDALADVRRRLGLSEGGRHDDALRALLEQRLVQKDGIWTWPRSVCSALVYWTVAQH
ncbi:MAG: hypothetical protein JXC32_07215 [Anaerolineae bacterium]|nr:hypothetical protein [Anaerolineae bacterium]